MTGRSDTKYLHTDHLGSIDTITNEAGHLLECDSYDAWGTRRATDNNCIPQGAKSLITRGYTGHEMLDDLGLIHMNGRVYDPGLGRFLSADPFVLEAVLAHELAHVVYGARGYAVGNIPTEEITSIAIENQVRAELGYDARIR